MVLTAEERKQFIKTTVEVTNGRTAVIASVSATNSKDAVAITEFSQKCGADAVIAMPPYVGDLNFDGVKKYYKAIAAATTLPVMIQNQFFHNISINEDQLVELCSLAENISWVKQEVAPAPTSIERLSRKKSPAIEGYMSGFSGMYSLQDYANGAIATIHACEYCDLIQRIWDFLENGQEEKAAKLHSAVLPGLILEGIYGWQYAKIIMQKRGIFKNYFTRNQSNMISEQSMKHIEKTWERIEKLL
jgi:4-hydroxy-tetrahydrodipicolinate synthase